MGEQKEFEKAVRRVIDQVSFHQDNKVQIFELNIRALGGLVISENGTFDRTRFNVSMGIVIGTCSCKRSFTWSYHSGLQGRASCTGTRFS